MLPILLLLAVAVHTLLPRFATIEQAAQLLQRLRRWAVALAVLAQAARYWGNGKARSVMAALSG